MTWANVSWRLIAFRGIGRPSSWVSLTVSRARTQSVGLARRGMLVSGRRTARAGLVGQELDTVSFVRDYIELRIGYSILRALGPAAGSSTALGGALDDERGADLLRRYIGRAVTTAEIIENERILLVFGSDDRIDLSLPGGPRLDLKPPTSCLRGKMVDQTLPRCGSGEHLESASR